MFEEIVKALVEINPFKGFDYIYSFASINVLNFRVSGQNNQDNN